ncbi:DUF6114 domain-containing protein [Streptomyces sp. H10-C2]|uniref:DUF6114 domain-containing protein n=1 Tax=unclassified Streptomyces TaxID=2593676 RepID=UPI0024BAE2E6|nr:MULTISPECIES: DUF6114 domain-containing protein [unclassified Streptomyces]MDJ0344148.1 DUF6114 domain-containing protein [Streptomyces sp. PH10-H1]MDJ0373093.1 DUF6114 domain-containing protein [Streptomyces sp. H10-C2]
MLLRALREAPARFQRLHTRLPLPDQRRALREWRRTRPFWGGLLLILGGAELLVIPLSPLTVLVSLGLGGLAAIGIGLALIVAGLFLWFLPHTRHYVSINALILSVLSFAATNLGGFLVGMLLGIAGSAIGFGWTPVEPEPADTSAASDPKIAPDPDPDPEPEPEPGVMRGAPGRRALAVALPVVLLALIGGAGAAPVRAADSGAGTPRAGAHPPTVTTTRFSPNGFALSGVTTMPTADGPLKVMIVTMASASLTDYRLSTHDGGGRLALSADSLDLSGNVILYLTRLSGCIEGVLCVTFTPDKLPMPPVIPPGVYLTHVEAEQALVTSDSIVARSLNLRAETR